MSCQVSWLFPDFNLGGLLCINLLNQYLPEGPVQWNITSEDGTQLGMMMQTDLNMAWKVSDSCVIGINKIANKPQCKQQDHFDLVKEFAEVIPKQFVAEAQGL